MDEDYETKLAAYNVALEALPTLARAVFLTIRDSGRPYREIAASLGLQTEEIKEMMTYSVTRIAQTVLDNRSTEDSLIFKPTTDILMAERRLASREAALSADGLEQRFEKNKLFGDDDDHAFRPPYGYY